MHFFQTSAGRFVKEQTKSTKLKVKKSKRSAKTVVRQHRGRVFSFSRHRKSATRQNSLSPFAFVSNIPPPQREKMSASPASYNVTLATLRTTSPSRNKTRKQVRQQTEKEKRRARLLKKLEIVALRERGFAAHNVRFFKPLHYPLFLL